MHAAHSGHWHGAGGLGFVEDEDVDMGLPVVDTQLMRDGDDDEDIEILLEPKVESPENGLQMLDVQEPEVLRVIDTVGSAFQAKRPRGRPRKHPVPTQESLAKVAKGRSKTGCITCRKRKKKCDEAKPRCKFPPPPPPRMSRADNR